MDAPYNVDLMLQIKEQTTAHPETHDQSDWARRTECGTTLCIAGWACVLTGETLHWWGDEWFKKVGYEAAHAVVSEAHSLGHEAIPAVAAKALGLTGSEADELFHTADNAAALGLLDRMIEAGKNGERVRP